MRGGSADRVRRQTNWQGRSGGEIDFVLEVADGRVGALEVKTEASPPASYFTAANTCSR
jgi:hypothetical protein